MSTAVIFDMDGTLLDSMPVWKRLTQRYLAQFDVHITDADYAACEGFSQPQVAEYFLKRYPNLPLTQQQMLDGDEFVAFLTRLDEGHVQADFEFLGDHQFSSMMQASGCWCWRANARTCSTLVAAMSRGKMPHTPRPSL